MAEEKPRYKREKRLEAPMIEEEPKIKAPEVEKQSWLEKKIEAISKSEMPDWQKEALLKEIGAFKKETISKNKVPFIVYAKVKKIELGRHKAMMAYPKAKSVPAATLAEWDEIFKDF